LRLFYIMMKRVGMLSFMRMAMRASAIATIIAVVHFHLRTKSGHTESTVDQREKFPGTLIA
jgi:hypothetical protein